MTRDEIAQAMQDSAGNSWGDEAHFQRFAALVIKPWAKQLEVERKKFQELNDIVAVGMQHARADEREACARVCEDEINRAKPIYSVTAENALRAIRARGSKPTAVIYSPGQLAERGLTHEDVVKLIKENT